MSDARISFLREAAGRPFVWGSFDCCLFAAEWVLRARGVDPAAPFRGTYRTERDAYRTILRAGGLVALMAPHMARCGLAETTDPQAGDVAVVDAAGSHTVAIRVASGWACKGVTGLVVTPATPLMAWSI